MFSIRSSSSKRPATRKKARRLSAENLESRRVLAGSIDVCFPLENVDSGDVPAEQGSPFAGKFGKNDAGHIVKPFRINGGGPAPAGLPLGPGLPPAAHSATGNATGLGQYTGEGALSLAGPLEISESGAVTGTFQGTFVFVAANGDRLATVYGEGGTGILTGQLSVDGDGNPVVVDVKFDAFFAPDQANSTGRFENVVGGGWRMIAEAESVSLPTDDSPYTAPFDYTWSGTGTLEYAKKSK